MKIESEKVVTLTYEMYINGENGSEELIERATEQRPLVYCHGEKMMLPAFEAALVGKEKGDCFDFRIDHQHAYGEYDENGIMELDKQLFFNGDGEFDSERVYVGNVIPMNTVDGQIVNAVVIEISENKVTIDLNHPFAGEDLHFVGKIIDVREADEKELEAIRHPHHCGKCHGHCDDCGSDCGSECGGDCKGDCHCEKEK
ncbi:MAG: peptidylprolyl isomerase [Paludibacteraceae bacterium]|nr:peptidylprolyl isomerase [Paludibacteraceae bacterium]